MVAEPPRLKHAPRYSNNFSTGEVEVRCDCGWKGAQSLFSSREAEELWRAHAMEISTPVTPLPETKSEAVVKLAPVGITDFDRDAAKYFREMADRIEAGDVKNIVVAFSNKAEYGYERFAHFHDRWTMYGAIEYMRACIDSAD